MKMTITRLFATAALAVALFVPAINGAQAEARVPGGGRPPIPVASSIVQTTSTYTLFSNGLSVSSDGTITSADGTHYYANGDTVVYSDGTTVYPNGTIAYSNGAVVTMHAGL